MMRLHAKHVLLHEVNGTFEVLQPSSFGTIMGIGDEDVDIGFMMR